jgi:glycosyltransferase involved in cell wall biosynthesis
MRRVSERPATLTVITVVLNDPEGLERTLTSLEAQTWADWECVVVDGGSKDRTLAVLHAHADTVTRSVSEPDLGIYHAMNKGLDFADTEWLLFMNAGDEFADPEVLSAAMLLARHEVDIVYSDWVYREDRTLVRASHEQMNVRHQSVIYRKALHSLYGSYVVGAGVSISDYIFFQSVARRHWVYCGEPISCCDRAGVSANPRHFYQRLSVELIFGRRSRTTTALILLIHPVYRFIKRYVLRRR